MIAFQRNIDGNDGNPGFHQFQKVRIIGLDTGDNGRGDGVQFAKIGEVIPALFTGIRVTQSKLKIVLHGETEQTLHLQVQHAVSAITVEHVRCNQTEVRRFLGRKAARVGIGHIVQLLCCTEYFFPGFRQYIRVMIENAGYRADRNAGLFGYFFDRDCHNACFPLR